MNNADYNSSSSPYYYPQQPQYPNQKPIPTDPYPPPSYASAPPFSPTPQPSTYPSFPDHIPTAPSSYPQQHQQSYSFPHFESSHGGGPYEPPPPKSYQPYDTNYNPNPSSQQQYPSIVNNNDQYNQLLLNNFDDNNNYNNSDRRSDGVYAYKGSSEPYGARGTGSKSSTWSGTKSGSGSGGFDDFGRPIGYSNSGGGKDRAGNNGGLKVVRAVPKVDTTEDGKGGVQKFRVKLLAESGGQSTMDVLCQIGLDGIRMLDPSTNRTLRIYLLDAITRCEAIDSSTFAFWSKSSVDIEPRRIRLQSNRYTTNTLLDTVTAVIVQYKEIGGTSKPYESPKIAEQPTEKKKGFVPWVNLIKPVNEEKDHWVPDEAAKKCISCGTDFSAFNRKHHCRNCGDIFCDKCTQGRTALTADENAPVVRVCDRCLAEVSRRLSIAKESVSRSTSIQSHEDLAKKLQEEMARSCKVSSGSRSESSGRRMKEVECPTCTVHLQVLVPSSGSETIECGVCQHPFLVSSH